MRWFRDKKISVKLITGFLVVAFIATIIGVVGILNISSIGKLDKQIIEENVDGFGFLATAEVYYQRVRFKQCKRLY